MESVQEAAAHAKGFEPLYVWEVRYGGPEESESLGLFEDEAQARVVYVAIKMLRWHYHAEIDLLGLHSSRDRMDMLSEDKADGRDGWYCNIGRLYWVELKKRLLIPKQVPRA